MGLVLGMALAACSGSNESNGDTRAARDTAATAPAHDMSAMGGAAAGDSSMAGMDHSAMGGDTGAAMAGMDHSQMAAAGGSGAMAGMDHSGMNMGAAAATTGGSARPGSMAGMDHANMPGMQTSGSTMAGMDHSTMAAPARGSTAARGAAQGMAEMDHANMPGVQMGNARTQQPAPTAGMDHSAMPGMQQQTREAATAADPGAEKLRALVAELVQDSVVQRRIQQDSALREAWSKPAVREEVLDPQ